MLKPTKDVAPSPHRTVGEQKVREAKVTANQPQSQDSNGVCALPRGSSEPPPHDPSSSLPGPHGALYQCYDPCGWFGSCCSPFTTLFCILAPGSGFTLIKQAEHSASQLYNIRKEKGVIYVFCQVGLTVFSLRSKCRTPTPCTRALAIPGVFPLWKPFLLFHVPPALLLSTGCPSFQTGGR